VRRIVLGYALFAGLWILLSDRAIGWLFQDPQKLVLASSLKGLVFVLVTSVMLFAALARDRRALAEREARNRRQEQEKLRALHLLGVLSEASPDAIYVKDLQGRYLLFNRAAGQMVGKDPEEVLGQDDRAIFPPGEAEAIMAQDQRVMDQGDVATYEARLTTTAGVTDFLVTQGPIRDAAMQPYALFGVARDITQSKRVDEALRASEQKFSNIFRMSPDPIDVTRLETGVMLDCNPSYTRVFGYTREEVIGRSSLPGDLGVWVDARERDRHLAELKANGIAVGFETVLRRKDGSTFIAEISSAVLEVRGEPCNLSLARDITAQKRTEEALRESNRRLELAVQAGQLGIWDRNLEDGTYLWSERMCELYGLEPHENPPSFDTWYRTYLHPEDREAFQAGVQAALDGKQYYRLEFRVIRRDGRVLHLRSEAQVLRDAQGRAVRIIGIAMDRTRQVEAQAEQRRLQAELQHAEKLESIGSLAGGVAHDMNNVLAAILGLTSALRSALGDEDAQAKPLDTIIRACNRGRDVVKSLLYFARRDLETVGPVSLNIIVEEVVHLLTYTTLKRVRTVTDLQEPLPCIEGDGGALSHALISLCVNAVDAMPEGGTLSLATRMEGETVVLQVQDTGQGMTPEVVRRSVEPFFTTKPVGKGTGLGLAMVYGTVKAHKGTFEIRSEPGQGTAVILGFPAVAGFVAASAPAPAGAGVPAPRSIRILLVDDDELIRTSVGPMLTALGHEVHLAESGQEALDRLGSGLEVDLVILDQNMPGLNGAQTLARLLELRPDQKVLMATGYSDDSLGPLLAGRPRVSSLQKPFSLQEIRAKLEAIS
jgi:PAS domain S-box-containing protein